MYSEYSVRAEGAEHPDDLHLNLLLCSTLSSICLGNVILGKFVLLYT